MTKTRGRCTNFDYCATAGSRHDVSVALGQDFVCPECGKPLKAPRIEEAPAGNGRLLLLGGAALVLIGGGIIAYGALSGSGHAPVPPVPAKVAQGLAPPPAAAAPPAKAPAAPLKIALIEPPKPPPVTETTVLRLSGSNTVGAVLGPRLAQAYLASTGDTNVTIVAGGQPDEVKVIGQRGDTREAITVAAHGSATAFADLIKGATDIGMSSRRIKPAEADSLKTAGDMTDAGHEHVLALDGLAVIVNPANGVGALTKTQVHDIFVGSITDWAQLGATPGAIHLYSRDDKSGTYDTFKALVLGSGKLSATAKRIEDSRELSADVSGDPAGIGFIGLPYVLSARAVPVADTGAAALLPNRLTVGTEDYPLSRRLYLYSGAPGGNRLVPGFVEFALSPQGQAIAEQVGFVALTVRPEAAVVPATASDKLRQLLGRATRLSTNFRFQVNSVALDNRGQRDLDRLVNFVVSAHATPQQIILVGFADNKGSPGANLTVSKRRAEAVAAGLAQRGVQVGRVAAFGADLPVADNGSDDGREKNRRVEVYLAL